MTQGWRPTRRDVLSGLGMTAGMLLGGPAFSRTVQGKVSLMVTGQALIEHDLRQFSYPGYAAVAAFLKKSDARVTDLEVAIRSSLSGKPTRQDMFFHAAEPQVLDALKDMGFNMLALANNHAFDLGLEGVQATRKAVEGAGFIAAGTGSTDQAAAAAGYLNVRDRKISLISMATGKLPEAAVAGDAKAGVNQLAVGEGAVIDHASSHRNIRAIQEAAAADAIVIACHHNHAWGDSLHMTPEWQRRWAHDCIDAGASVYISHGSMSLMGIEIYRGCPIFYGLGNFIFHTRTNPEFYPSTAWDGVIAECRFDGRKCKEVVLQPVTLNEWGQEGNNYYATRGRPSLAAGDDAFRILEHLTQHSTEYRTRIHYEAGQGFITLG